MSAFPLGLEHYERWADGFEEASSYKYQGAGSDKGGCCPPDFCVTGQRCHGPSSTGCKLCLQWQVTNSTSVCCWDHSYSGQWCLSCLHSPPSPVHIFPQLTQTNSMANLIEAEQKQLLPSVILTVLSPAWHLVNQVEIELYRWIEVSRESYPGGKKKKAGCCDFIYL